MATTWNRLMGAFGMISGALTVLFWPLHPVAADPHAPRGAAYWDAVQSGRFVAVNGMFLAIILTSLLALVGFAAKQSKGAGRLGMAGGVLAFLGTALFIGPGVFTAFMLPALAASEATRLLLANDGPLLGGPMGGVFAAGGITFAVGYVLFGVATARAGVLPRAAGWMLVVSSPILGLSPLMPLWARAAGSTVWGAAILWLGFTLWRSTEFLAERTARAVTVGTHG
jgi:hypothetical protein